MCVTRNILKNPKLLPGGGATELTVSATLKQKSSSVEGVEKVLFRFSLLSLLMIRAFIGIPSANG
jgi:chaperonin GroEL (HSP60 family)